MLLPENCRTVQSTTYTVTVEVRVSEWERNGKTERIVSQHDANGKAVAAEVVGYHDEARCLADAENMRLGYHAERDKTTGPLAAFGRACLVMHQSPNGIGDLDAGWLQDTAAALGALVPVEVTEPCRLTCACEEFPGTCYRPCWAKEDS